LPSIQSEVVDLLILCAHSTAFASQGASKVLVEQKLESSEGFGKGRKVHMTFGQLVQQLHKGNDSLYLTTQEVSHMHMLLHQSIHCLLFLYSKYKSFFSQRQC